MSRWRRPELPDLTSGQRRLMARHQLRFDQDFPEGLLAAWDDPGGPVHTYPVPRVEVLSMAGLDPVVRLPVDDWAKTVDGTVVSYNVQQTQPCLVVRVGFASSPDR